MISTKAQGGDANAIDPFADIETLGLRRSGRTRKEPERMSALDPKSKDIRPM